VSIKIDLSNLQRELSNRVVKTKQLVEEGLLSGAKKSLRILVKNTPEDTGELSKSWKVHKAMNGVTIENDAPYAGVVEEGARPHGVNAEGIRSLTAWAGRTFPGASPEAIKSIVWGVVRKLKEEGQEPTFFVKNSLEAVVKEVVVEVGSRILANSKRRA